MTRTNLAISIVLLAAPSLLGPTAQAACIACEYVPEVVRGSRTSDPPPYVRAHPYAVEREHRAFRAAPRIVKREPVPKNVETSDTTPVKTEAKNENSSISVVAEAATTQIAKVEPRTAQAENSSIAASASSEAVTAMTKDAAGTPAGCKQFFPTIGLTVTVPCE